MPDNQNRFHIISGGPGSGKSTLINALEQHGFGRTIEAGRAIIQQQQAIGGSALPWADRALFAELMLSWELQSYSQAKMHEGIVFFDRGLPDITGYLLLCGLEVPAYIRRAAENYRYNKTVFLAPPWREIFTQDSERKQEYSEAVKTFETMQQVYEGLGYKITLLPKGSVQERLEFILSKVA